MHEDTGPRRSNTPARRRQQPGFPFWVIRSVSAANGRPAIVSAAPQAAYDGGEQPSVGRAAIPRQRQRAAPAHTGRTGVDLRAGTPVPPRPSLAAPPTARRRIFPWRRGTQPTPLLPAPTKKVGEVIIRRSRRSVYALVALAIVQTLFLAAIAWGLTSPTFQARYVQVQGTSDPTLLAAIRRLPLAGCNIFRCDLSGRARMVEALPAVASADVHTIYPNGLLVVVTPRHPALLWQTANRSVVVASDGTVLGPLDSDPTYAHLPLLPVSDPGAATFSGQIPQPGARIPAAEAEMAGQLRVGMTKTLGEGWTLQWTADTGFVASDGSGIRVLFGTPADAAQALTSYPDPATLAAAPTNGVVDQGVAAQLQMLVALRAQLARSGQQAVLIDLRWGPHPYYRLA